jgi:tRNA-dihydrouridine synthase A
MLGLYHGQSGGRRYRQILSDAARLRAEDAGLLLEALDAVEPGRRAA